MQTFEIFKQGKHTAASGQTLEFSEDMLKAAVDAYDPALHEAPIVVGHPKDNGPAYGWIKSLNYSDGMVTAEPIQVDPDFAEMVSAGRFKKRSASFYLPDSPSNPKPGTLYLRHVGFLGAQPPAIKGLKDVNFNDTEQGVVEFSDPYIVASVFRRLREFILTKFTADDADRVVPDYMIQSLEAEDRARMEATASPATSFNETEDAMSKELQDKLAAAEAENAKLKADKEAADKKAADFAEAEKAIKAREQALARKEIGVEVKALVTAGKVLPAHEAGLTEFMASLDDGETVVEFGEGDKAQKLSPRAYMRQFLNAQPKLVDFKEHSGEDGADNGSELRGQDLANKAIEYREAMASKGVEISVTEAVAAVREGKKA